MKASQDPSLFIWGGISGVFGTILYVAAIAIPFPPLLTYILAMCWPILSIIFVFALYKYIALEHQSAFSQLALIMACIAFAMVALMISVQMSVRLGITEYLTTTPVENKDVFVLIRKSVRMVDMGIDVAWDIFIGVSLIFLGIAIKSHKSFGIWWASAAMILAVALLVLNLITFPWPPDSRELMDVGPAIGLFIIILSTKLYLLGNRMKS